MCRYAQAFADLRSKREQNREQKRCRKRNSTGNPKKNCNAIPKTE